MKKEADLINLTRYGVLIDKEGYEDLSQNFLKAIRSLIKNDSLKNKRKKCIFLVYVLRGSSESPHKEERKIIRTIGTLIKYFKDIFKLNIPEDIVEFI